MLGFKRGAILVSLCWVAILVHIIDRKWWQATVWALLSSILTAVGIIHVQVRQASSRANTPLQNVPLKPRFSLA